ncbi:unnamed protein product [Urochloa humidicola]
MSREKRKVVEELGEQVVSAAVGDVFARTMSAAVGRYAAHASLGEQVERLGTLVIMVHSAVEAAEGVHIRSWWLRRWLWRLRDAALDGDEVLRSSLTRQRQQKAEEAETTGGGGGGKRLWNTLRRAFRSAKRLLLAGDDSTAPVSAAVARLESLSTGLADFLKLLDMEITKSRPPPPPLPAVPRIAMVPEAEGDYHWSGSTMPTRQQHDDASDPSIRQLFPVEEEILHGVLDVPPPPPPHRRRFDNVCGRIESSEPKPKRSLDGSEPEESEAHDPVRSFDEASGGSYDEYSSEPNNRSLGGGAESEDDLSNSSYKENDAARRKFALVGVWQNIRRAMSRLTTRTPAPAPASSDDLWTTLNQGARLRVLVNDIRRALRASDRPEVHGKMWLAEWRRELHAVADTAERVLPIQNVPDIAGVATSGDDEMRRTAQSVHTAAGHLKCFLTLVRLAVSRGIPTA